MAGDGMTIGHVPGVCFGPGERFDDLLERDDISEVHVGSFTYRSHYGNLGTRQATVSDGAGVITAADCRNPGITAVASSLPAMHASAREDYKQLRVSITSDGYEPDELPDLARMCAQAGVDVLEIDVSCPYVWHDGSSTLVLGFDDDALAAVLGSIQLAIADCTPRAVELRLPPYHDRSVVHVHQPNASLPHVHKPNLKRSLRCIKHFPFVSGVVLHGGMPQVRALNERGRELLETTDGVGILEGRLLRSSALEHVEESFPLSRHLHVHARGGFARRADGAEARACGASGVQFDAGALGYT